MKFATLAIIAGMAALSNPALAQDEPIRNVVAARHQYLAQAQLLGKQAYEQLTNTQKYNHYDMKDHAEKAKEFLEQANQEIRLATDAANAADAQHRPR